MSITPSPTLRGVSLSHFVQDYCATHNILFDPDILNDGFLKNGYVASKTYTEECATAIIETTAQQWHLRDAQSQLAILHPRNGVPPSAERN